MKKIALIVLTVFMSVVMMSSFAFAKVSVKGYTTKKGTYVAPHYRTSPNRTIKDNWSTKGNFNPYTGKKGYKTYR